jgi:putative oxidoreductase
MERKYQIMEGFFRALIAAIFLYAAIVKILHPTDFLSDVQHYRLTGENFSIAIAFYLPWLELICALGLLFKKLYLGALTLLSALMGIFVAAILSAWIRGLNIECGCFGSSHGLPQYGTWLFRDLLIWGMILVLWIISLRMAKRA